MLFFVAFFYLIISIFKEQLAFLIILILLPSYLIRFKIDFIPSTFLESMIIILLSVWIIKLILNKKFKQTLIDIKNKTDKTFLVVVLLFILFATISIFISPDKNSALGIWKAYFIEPFVLFLIGLNLFKKKDLPKIIFALAISAFLISFLAIIQKFTGLFVPWTFWGKNEVFRVTSTASHKFCSK